jgi:N utilization substance protein A
MGVDPVGSCVGQKGVRVQAVINELGDEKIDVISYQEDTVEFIKAALSPAKDLTVKIAEKEKTAEVTVADDQLSLAIGRDGQNVRLAAKLTGFKIDIKGKSGTPREVEEKERKAQEEAKIALGVEKGTAEKETKKEATGKSDQPADDQTQAKKELSAKEEPKKLKAPKKSKSEDSTLAGNQDEKQSSDDGKTT